MFCRTLVVLGLALAVFASPAEGQLRQPPSNPGQPRSNPPVTPPRNNPPTTPIGQPKFTTPNNPPVNPQPIVNPQKGGPVNPPPLTTKGIAPPPVTTKIGSPTRVLPTVDAVKNPVTKLDKTTVDPLKLANAQKSVNDNLNKGQASLISLSKSANADVSKAVQDGRSAFAKNLTPGQLKQADEFGRLRTKTETNLLTKNKVAPPKVSSDASKLVASAPKITTKQSAKALSLTTNDNQRIIDLKNGTTDPYGRRVYDDILSGRRVGRSDFAYLQAQLNNPALSNASKATIASALQNQADFRRQNNYLDAISRLNGGGGYIPYVPRPGGGFGPAFAGGFAGGFVGTLVGNLVYPGGGIIVPGGYNPTYVLPGNVLFDPSGLTGYIDYSPAIYYPPTQGLELSGAVVVQTLPCGCVNTVYSGPVQSLEPTPGVVTPDPQPGQDPAIPGGTPAIVIDPTSQEVKLTTRYLRLINSSKEKVTVSIVLRTPSGDDGAFVWLPDEPGKGDGAFTVELMPGEEKDIHSNDTALHGSRARIWGTGESGRTWRQFENVDFWLVPETEVDGTHAYAAPGMETAVYNLQ